MYIPIIHYLQFYIMYKLLCVYVFSLDCPSDNGGLPSLAWIIPVAVIGGLIVLGILILLIVLLIVWIMVGIL